MNTNNTNTKPIKLNYEFIRRNKIRLHRLIDNLFDDYSKLLVIRMDFYLKKDFQETNTYEHMNTLFEVLRNYSRFNQLFDDYITYAARLEYGSDRKWHYHVLFFFNGQRVKDDYGLAQRLGEYWVKTITRGLGSYHSPNMNRSNYQEFALGMIDYTETDKINNLKEVANYLVKQETGLERSLRAKSGQRLRCYRQGSYKPRGSVLGRPRGHAV